VKEFYSLSLGFNSRHVVCIFTFGLCDDNYSRK
jgi:hypothetical protein